MYITWKGRRWVKTKIPMISVSIASRFVKDSWKALDEDGSGELTEEEFNEVKARVVASRCHQNVTVHVESVAKKDRANEKCFKAPRKALEFVLQELKRCFLLNLLKKKKFCWSVVLCLFVLRVACAMPGSATRRILRTCAGGLCLAGWLGWRQHLLAGVP